VRRDKRDLCNFGVVDGDERGDYDVLNAVGKYLLTKLPLHCTQIGPSQKSKNPGWRKKCAVLAREIFEDPS